MEKQIDIVEAVSPDYPIIADIYNAYIRLGTATMDESLKTKDDISAWIKKFNSREKLLVLKENGLTIGWGIIKRYSDREGYRFAAETAVYIADDKLRAGYGTMMKKYLLKVCKDLNYKHLIAKVFADNKGSIQYNLNLGYTIVGRQQQIGYKNQQWLDIVIMQYIIV